MLPNKVDLSSIDDYYDSLRKALPNPDRKEPYILCGKKERTPSFFMLLYYNG